MNNIEEKVEKAIRIILRDFERFPDKYLTESDVRCFLINELMKFSEFKEIIKTEDGSESIPIHTEVRWYGQSGRLKWRSDIVIIEVSKLRVKNGSFKLPSKGYSFELPQAIIEIKLRRINGKPDNEFIKKIQDDFKKLEKIKNELPGNYNCYLLLLDKKNDIERDIQGKITISNEIKIFYGYSNYHKKFQ